MIPREVHAQSAALSRYVIQRDSSGKLVSISIAKPAHAFAAEPNLLDEMRQEYDQQETRYFSANQNEVLVPETADDKKVYDKTREALSRKVGRPDLDDPKLQAEFAKADAQLSDLDFFQIIAAPYNPEALDQGKETKRTIEGIVEAADFVLLPNPFSVFKFLVYQHVESLESRRIFFQNELLVLLDSPDGAQFSAEEKSRIRSSIFYSRIDIFSKHQRSRARSS